MNAPTHQAAEWLAAFGSALDRADFTAATQLFGEDCYWRDLVSLTWNIVTLEGKESIQAMLNAAAPKAQPGRWQLDGEATLDDGVISGWFTFETAVARGKGHLRL